MYSQRAVGGAIFLVETDCPIYVIADLQSVADAGDAVQSPYRSSAHLYVHGVTDAADAAVGAVGATLAGSMALDSRPPDR